MPKIVKVIIIVIAALAALYMGIMQLILPHYVSALVPTVESTAADYINGKVNIGQINLSPGLTITAGDISVANNKGEEVVQIPSVDIGISLWGGLQSKSTLGAINSIRINNPVVTMSMDKQDKWNVSGLIKQSESKSNDFKGKIYVNNGHLLVNTPYGRWEAGVQGKIDAANDPDYDIDTNVFLNNETLAITGHINTDLEGRLNVKTSSMKLDGFAALIAHYVPVQKLSGSLQDVDISWQNAATVVMSGGGMLKDVKGTVIQEAYELPLTLNGNINFNGMELQAKNLKALVKEEVCTISGGLDLTDVKNPKAENLSLAFDKFDLQKAEASLPVSGEISGTMVVSGSKDDYSVQGKLTAPTLAAHGLNFTKVILPVVTNQGKIILQDAEADFGGGHLRVTGEYGIHSQNIAAGVDAANVDLTSALGNAAGSLQVNGSMLLSGNLNKERLKLNSVGDFMTLTWQGTEFRNLALDVDVTGDHIILNNFSGYTADNGVVWAQGKLEQNALEGKGALVRLPLDNLLPLAGQTGKGFLSGHFTLSGSTSTPNVTGAFSLENGEVNHVKIAEAHGFMGWENRMLSLKKVEVNMEQGRHLLDGTVDLNSSDPVFNLKVETNGVRIEPLWQLAGASFPVTGNLNNTVQLEGPLSNLTALGQVKAWDGSVNNFLVDGVTGEYSYHNGTLVLKKFQISTLTTTINLDGKMLPDGTLDIGMDAKNVHLARVPSLHNYAEVTGVVDFSGSIAGTYKNPLFNGALTSNNILVNGEGFNGIACYLYSQGGMVNKLNGTFQQTAGGDYAVNLLLDFNEHLAQGEIDIQKGNVKSLLHIAKEDLDIEGLLTGRVELNKAAPHSGMTIIGNIDQGAVCGIGFKSAEFDVFSKRGYWRINNLKAVENDGGLLLAKGEVDFSKNKRTIDMEIGTSAANAKLLTVAMTHPLDLEGKMDIGAQLKGSLDNPEGNFSLQVSPGKISGVDFDNLYGMVTLRNDMFKLEQVMMQKGEYKISAYGNFPQDLMRRADQRRNPGAKMNLSLNLDNANLAILPSISPVVELADGGINGNLTITGTMEDYGIDGKVQIESGTVKFKHVKTTLDNIKLDAVFGGKQINLKELSATTGKKGKLEAHGTFALTEATEAPYLLDFSAKDVKIESSIFTGTINADGEIEQKRNRPHITSHIRLDDVTLDVVSIPELAEGDSNLGLNVTLELGPKIHMHNTYFYNLWLAGGLHAMGSTRYPRVEGRIYATKGTISYLSTPFKIDHAELNWPQRGFTPHVNFEANTRFRNYNIKVKANGPLTMDTLSANLSSSPPKSQKEIVRMLTLKTDSANTEDDMQSLVDAGLQMAFLSDIEDYVKRTLTLDDFRVYSGNTRSSLGFDLDSLRANSATGEERKQYNVLFSKYISKHIMVGYTTSFDQEYHSVFAEYDLSRHFSLNFSQNEKSEQWYGIQYQTTF